MDYYKLLEAASLNIGLQFDDNKYDSFIKYMKMIQEWNEKINLTAITEDDQIIKKHFMDSIKIFNFDPLKKASKVIDIGTGGGFPGIPMKIVMPNLNMVLLDSLNKRINFLNEVISSLNLNSIRAIHGRAEDFARQSEYRDSFDAAVSRAVANMATLSELCLPYVKVGGYFIAMKGPSIDDEIKESKNAIGTLGGKLEEIIPVDIEESDLKHNIVIIRKVKETPALYPRKAGSANKKPIK